MDLYSFSLLFIKKLVPFAYALIGFGLLITIHEFGHFLFCKFFGIHTPTFSIGMGPTLFKRKIGKTLFRLAAIPIGGYVEIAGMAEVGQGDQAHAKEAGANSFRAKPFWQKFLVLTGGILFNLIFSYFIFSTLYFVGMPVTKEVELVVKKVTKSPEGQEDFFQPGDKVVRVGGYTLSDNPKELFPKLREVGQAMAEKKEDVWVRVLRGKRELEVKIPASLNGTRLGLGLLGGTVLDVKSLKVDYERYSLVESIKRGFQTTNTWIVRVLQSLKMLVTKRNIKDFGGPIKIVSKSFEMAQQGLLWLLVFLAIISINLAVINILPIGALDGGQLLFETVEAIIRRPIPDVIRFTVNLVSWVFILGLILFLSYQDILGLIFG